LIVRPEELGNGAKTGIPSSASPGSQFDDFLFSTLFETEETSVSVLSALTRLGIDPWIEAILLDQLSKDDAVKRLSVTIRQSNNLFPSDSDALTEASTFVARLPSHRSALANIAWEQNEGKVIMRLIYLYYAIVLVLIVMSGSGYFEQPASKFNFFRDSNFSTVTEKRSGAPSAPTVALK
jgi:hypothetical protein